LHASGIERRAAFVAGDFTGEATQLAMLTLRLSGLVQVQVTVDGLPAVTVAGFAEQEICGAFFGCSFTLKLAWHDALSLESFASLTRAVTV